MCLRTQPITLPPACQSDFGGGGGKFRVHRTTQANITDGPARDNDYACTKGSMHDLATLCSPRPTYGYNKDIVVLGLRIVGLWLTRRFVDPATL